MKQRNSKFLSEQKTVQVERRYIHMYYNKKSILFMYKPYFVSVQNKLSVSSHIICIVFTTNFMFLDQMLH